MSLEGQQPLRAVGRTRDDYASDALQVVTEESLTCILSADNDVPEHANVVHDGAKQESQQTPPSVSNHNTTERGTTTRRRMINIGGRKRG